MSYELVLLRPWMAADLPTVEEAASDPYIPSITTVPASYTLAEGMAWLERQWDKTAANRARPLAIVELATGRAVGMAILDQIDWSAGSAHVGYWLVPSARGKGLAKAAVAQLIAVAESLGLTHLEAFVAPDNTASIAICRSLGFTPNGPHHDMIKFTLNLPRP